MSYNSKLISDLYNAPELKDITEILDEMVVIGDEVFIRSIIDSFISNRESHYSHYYTNAIIAFSENNETLELVKDLILDYKSYYPSDIDELFQILMEHNYINSTIIVIGSELVQKASIHEIPLYEVTHILDYFHKLKKAESIEESLFRIFTNNDLELSDRSKCFRIWLTSNTERNLNLLLDANIEDLRKNNIDIIIATILVNWKGPKIEKLKEKISLAGSEKAKQIILRDINRKNELKIKKEHKIKNEEISKFRKENTDTIKNIIELRQEINRIFMGKFQLELFIQTESIILEVFTPENLTELSSSCIRLRDIYQGITSLKDHHGLTAEEQKKILPNVDDKDLNKGINAFYLFLKSKSFAVDESIFGLRKLQKVCALIGSHSGNDKEELMKQLEKNGWKEFYLKSDFTSLQEVFLKGYKDFLERILNEFRK